MPYILTKSEVVNQNISKSIIGQKAFGLTKIPPSWSPPYIIISTSFLEDYLKEKDKKNTTIQCWVSSKIEKQICKFLNTNKAGKVIVRSSATNESIDDRGRHESIVCEAEIGYLKESISKVYESWLALPNEYTTSHKMAIIIQLYISPIAKGHLSNERRVSYLSRDWTVEFEKSPTPDISSIYTFKVFKNRLLEPAIQLELNCKSSDNLIKQLKQPAINTTLLDARIHYEWVWDTQKIWIVQADQEIEKDTKGPHSFFESIPREFTSNDFSILQNLDEKNGVRWEKTLNVLKLESAGLNTVKLYLLNGEKNIKSISNNDFNNLLTQDLTILLDVPVVARTDLDKKQPLTSRQMLPRKFIKTLDEMKEFLVTTVKSLKNKIDFEDICFIFHQYIPSISSAYCYAHPERHRVRVDSIWGLPDGLLYYQHDSFELDPDDHNSIETKTRYKSDYIAESPNGDWIPRKAGAPWDWRKSIQTSDLLEIASETKKFCEYLESPVKLMWFVETTQKECIPNNVPWYYELEEVPSEIETAENYSYLTGKSVTISNSRDIDLATELLSKQHNFKSIVLNLKVESIRDKDIVDKVSNLAKLHSLPVDLSGSILQHVYYQLTRNEVRVRCIDPFEPKIKGTQFEKLVRDYIPEKIKQHGENVKIRNLEGSELIARLKDKIIEEANELYWAETNEEVIEELADVFEVLSTYSEKLGVTQENIQEAREKKLVARGGFSQGTVLIETSEPPLIKTQSPKNKIIRHDSFVNVESNTKILIKSLPSSLKEDYVAKINKLGISLHIRYQKDNIIIEIIKKPDDPKESNDIYQLELPLS